MIETMPSPRAALTSTNNVGGLGGLPSPAELADYERAVPGAGERVLALAEKAVEQVAAISASENSRLEVANKREHLTRRLTQGVVALISITAVVMGSGILFLTGNWEASLIAVGVPACALAAMAFVTRPKPDRVG